MSGRSFPDKMTAAEKKDIEALAAYLKKHPPKPQEGEEGEEAPTKAPTKG